MSKLLIIALICVIVELLFCFFFHSKRFENFVICQFCEIFRFQNQLMKFRLFRNRYFFIFFLCFEFFFQRNVELSSNNVFRFAIFCEMIFFVT